VVLLALGLAALLATSGVAAARWARPRRTRRAAARYCPFCGSDAVDTWTRERAEVYSDRLELHCAVCGVWRRLRVTVWIADAYERRYEKDRAAIASAATRWQRDLEDAETRAFHAALNAGVFGPDDFLAATRPRSEH
jgi:hypothetical protein